MITSSTSEIELMDRLSCILKVQDAEIFSEWSMSLYGLMLLSDEIEFRRPEKIIEFGSGASSIVMARTIQKYNQEGQILSVENDRYYFDCLNYFIHKNHLHRIVQLIYSPLCPSFDVPNQKWYNQGILRKHILEQDKFDMVVIDGPPAWNNTIKMSRYGAIPFMMDHLEETYSIFLDDANREGEKEIMKLCKEQHKINFTVLNNRIAVSRK